jgi:hypothetical protein
VARRAGAGLTLAAVGVALGDDGGYSGTSRLIFSLVALAALVAAVASGPPRARRLARTPVLWVLAALGGLGAFSALWTVGIHSDAWHWGMTTGAVAALILSAAILVRDERDVVRAAAALAVMATGMGIVGLIGATDTIVPLAHREAGRWRPASTFQYSPALALLMVSVLPALLAGMVRSRSRWLAAAAAVGGGTAAAVLALAESRTQLAFAVVVGAAAIVVDRRHLAAVALLGASGLVAYAIAGGYIPVTPPPDGTARALGVLAVVVGTALAWLAVRAALARGVPLAALAAVLLAAGGVAAVAKPAPRIIAAGVGQARPAARPAPARRLHPIRDRLLHGRLKIWQGALDTFADRPLQGGGADSYLFASAPHQGPRTILYAHDLPLEVAAELGIAGLLLALALYGTAGRALWRTRGAPGGWLVWPAAAAFLGANLVDWPWHLAGSAAVWALAFGALLGASATQDGH